MTASIPIHSGMSAFAADYDGFVLDLWGVIHDGTVLFPGVVDCLERLDGAGKKIVMLTNAPRRAHAIAASMEKMGMPRAYCAAIMSSGEATHLSLRGRYDAVLAGTGPHCFHIGPERDENLFDGLDIERVADVAAADFIVNTGPWVDGAKVSDYEVTLAAGAGRGLPMVCANPDLEVIRGGNRIICAGALARRYEEMGGKVRYFGKPRPAIYDSCFAMLGIGERARILAVGDSLRTDIAGAKGAGIAAVLVAGGLHGEEFGADGGDGLDGARIARACAEAGVAPIAAIPGFVW